MGQGLKMGWSRAPYKDLIFIMQMNDLVSDLGVGRASVLSSPSLYPPPRSAGTRTAQKCFNPLYQPPSLPHLSFGLPTRKIPEGPSTFGTRSLGASALGLAF